MKIGVNTDPEDWVKSWGRKEHKLGKSIMSDKQSKSGLCMDKFYIWSKLLRGTFFFISIKESYKLIMIMSTNYNYE